MTDFEKALFKGCFDIIHGALDMLEAAIKECGNEDAVEAAALLMFEHLKVVRKLREKHEIPFE